ncbi:nucleotide sugar dehydrogenase [Mucilaginibacter sp. RS28]|uniref:Nucleotide sugar dehydrogenase n=1 Tax=Mucilaginibacter straminoryzae TaxID=2932774 RepID=A0A9X1X066_9SPHI|nr:nucleotide sugar dehydrogenase [Mucilaginibacter straminoryzae]MCJ8208628.1 nucleotide sugar dehydrogenase [Mucilaginibacter straminoryzae]
MATRRNSALSGIFKSSSVNNYRIAIIGLGYVGLPLAVEFAKKYRVTGFDIDNARIAGLQQLEDKTREVPSEVLSSVLDRQGDFGLQFSSELASIKDCNIYIVTVPTPINKFKAPNLGPLLRASEMIGEILKPGDIVIYESTVYPGCTEEDCVPVLEKKSGLKFNQDFFCGYSPERINPGDKINTLTKIKKVTSGSTPAVADTVDALYASIITAGTHRAPSIKVAEASKAIENAQRDINISFVNELALIFDKIGIDTTDVIEAASTKWNFLKYKPGLVGGHCIGVDPYYLAHKAEALGYHPQVILSGRRVNDTMGMFVASKVVKLMISNGGSVKGANALILGVTFKENCPDIRNSKVIDIYNELMQFGLLVDVYDPYADPGEVKEEYGIALVQQLNKQYDAIVLAVCHRDFVDLDYQALKKDANAVIFDTKSCLDRALVNGRL